MRTRFLVQLLIIILAANSCKKSNPVRSELKVTPNHFLSAGKYKKLVIDLVYDKGFPPEEQTVIRIKDFLAARINKPEGIEIHLKEINGVGKTQISLGDITQIEEASRVHITKSDVLTAFIYIPGAEYSENNSGYKTLGIQYGTNSIVLFGKTIRDHSGGLAQPSRVILETTIALHEIGHMLGLVNAGTDMVAPHMDSQHGHHCSNNNCLMYYLTETTNIVKNLSGTVPQLDNSCLTDLKNNGGK